MMMKKIKMIHMVLVLVLVKLLSKPVFMYFKALKIRTEQGLGV